MCRGEANDLAAMRDALAASERRLPGGAPVRWLVAAAAVLAIAVALAWFLLPRRAEEPVIAAPAAPAPAAPATPAPAVILTRPAILATLVRPTPVLRGSAGASFALRAPVATVVTEQRPQFSWDAVTGATSYDVAVADETGTLVASGTSKETSWRPDTALPRGKTYTWQVTARTSSGRVKAPGAADAEVLFHVAAHDVDATTPRERGIALAQLGALDEAERELERAGASDLLAQVRSWRNAGVPTAR
ncbi:MAG TPA: hypothetical protein VEK11_13025 [Thermoanaerobaculia bacterium]|nr:hypothetical protein [Thermoanaerobaculia bacterium]